MLGSNKLIINQIEMQAWCQEVLNARYSNYKHDSFGALVAGVTQLENGEFHIELEAPPIAEPPNDD